MITSWAPLVAVELVGFVTVVRAAWAQYCAEIPPNVSSDRRLAAKSARMRLGTWNKRGLRLIVAFMPTMILAAILWPVMVLRLLVAVFTDRHRAANFTYAAWHGRLRGDGQ